MFFHTIESLIYTMYPLNLPVITIVTPSLNQGDFIEKTITSVLSQGYPHLEYIVIDGGSTDRTIEVLSRHSEKIKWRSQKDNGQTEAINIGMGMANGDIITYLNADDILLPGSLRIVGEIFTKHRNVQWLTGRCMIINDKGDNIRPSISLYKNLLLQLRSYHALLVTNYIAQPATFLRRSLMEKCGIFDEELRYVMDYEYWLRLWKTEPPMILDQELAGFRIHSNAKTTSAGHLSQYINEEERIIARYTKSLFWRLAHKAHRTLMTKSYSLINR